MRREAEDDGRWNGFSKSLERPAKAKLEGEVEGA
jgi:hypothetical protein